MDANESLIVRQLSIEKLKRKTELAACITVHKLSGLSLWHVSHLPKQKELLIPFDNLFIFFFVVALFWKMEKGKPKSANSANVSISDYCNVLFLFHVFRSIKLAHCWNHGQVTLECAIERLTVVQGKCDINKCDRFAAIEGCQQCWVYQFI